MFRDKSWIRNTVQEKRYIAWEEMVETALERNPEMCAVVLEVGCGIRVPSVRLETETVVHDVLKRCKPNQIRLIRINPEQESIAKHFENRVDLPPDALIQIQATALDTLRQIGE